MVSRGFDPTARGDQSRGGSTHILKLYWDVPPLRVWFFDRPLIKRVSIFQDFHKFFYHILGQGFKVRAATPTQTQFSLSRTNNNIQG